MEEFGLGAIDPAEDGGACNRRDVLVAGSALAASLLSPDACMGATPDSRLLDARSDAVGSRVSARIAVIGAGAAGLNIARDLARRMDGVLLVESGGRSIEGVTQGLAAGRNVGLSYFDLLATRLRYYGGTTNHWSGFCHPHVDMDFMGRPALGILEWPVTPAQLKPHLEAAVKLLQLKEPNIWDHEAVIRGRGLDTAQMVERDRNHSGLLETRTSQFTPVPRLAPLMEPELSRLPGLTRILNLSVVELRQGSGSRIGDLRARTTTGKEVIVSADVFVLACHGIENARLLLSSTGRDPAGIGNRHGHVGRHFGEHPVLFNSYLYPSDRFPELYDFGKASRQACDIRLGLTEAVMQKEGVLNAYVRLVPEESDADRAVRRLKDSFFQPATRSLLDQFAAIAADPGRAWNAVRAGALGVPRQPYRFKVSYRLEQAPNPESRVVLGSARNAIGQPVANLDWRLNGLDLKTVLTARRLFAKEVSAMGWGRLELEPLDQKILERSVEGTHHQIGTTRMARRPEDGVTDFDGRVHGIDNLYVAGSGLFPNPGEGGTTLNLIALAYRQAGHLLDRFA